MRTTFLFCLWAFLWPTQSIRAQFFNGRITYLYTFFSAENPQDLGGQQRAEGGAISHYFTDGENYASLNNERYLTQLYINREKRHYSFEEDGKVRKMDVTVEQAGKPIVRHLEGTEQILGYDCGKLVIERAATITTYWYTDQFRQNSSALADHAFGNWNVLLAATEGAIPLKFVIEYPNEGKTTVAEAADIESLKLKAKDFSLPAYYRPRN